MIRIISSLLIIIGLAGVFFSTILQADVIIAIIALIISIVGFTLLVLGVSRMSFSFFLKNICTIPSEKQVIALTFDDGPKQSTNLLLDILDEHDAKATFFFTGKQALKYPVIVKRIINSGHTIGTHTYSHLKSFTFTGFRDVCSEISKGIGVIHEITGKRPVLFRPPFGVTNPVIAKGIKATGVISVGWNIRSLDTISDNPDKVLSRVIPKLQAGSIILLHDHGMTTLKVLPIIIKKIHNLGLKTVNLEQALNIKVYEDNDSSVTDNRYCVVAGR